MTEFFLRADIRDSAAIAATGAAELLQWAGKAADAATEEQVYRHREGRKTLRLEMDGEGFFLKSHRGVGWREIVKNLLLFRLPVVSAKNEYRAIRALERARVATLSIAAYASRGANPAGRQSMILTEELTGTISLEDYCAAWAAHPPPFALRMRLITRLAGIARRMHEAGINHRDFYLCHFHLAVDSVSGGPIRCYLIDLHRAQCRQRLPSRWRIKDLAGLYFSAMDCGLTTRDLQRFARHYYSGGLREAVDKKASLWRPVHSGAVALYQKANGCSPPALQNPEGREHGS